MGSFALPGSTLRSTARARSGLLRIKHIATAAPRLRPLQVSYQFPKWFARAYAGPLSGAKFDIVSRMNRKIIARISAGVLFLLIAFVAYTQNQPGKLTLNKVKDNLYEVEGDGGNVAVYITGDGWLMRGTAPLRLSTQAGAARRRGSCSMPSPLCGTNSARRPRMYERRLGLGSACAAMKWGRRLRRGSAWRA